MKKQARSRITNGRWPRGVDGRTSGARRWRDVHSALLAALGRDPNPVEGVLLTTATSLILMAEADSVALLGGRGADATRAARLTNALGRVLAALGLVAWSSKAPPAKETEMSVREILAQHAREQP